MEKPKKDNTSRKVTKKGKRMASAQELQATLRFLSQDARLPLATAMGTVKQLQAKSMMTPDSIAKASLKEVELALSGDGKTAKQVHNAAKKIAKKRSAAASNGGVDDALSISPSSSRKRGKVTSATGDLSLLHQTPAALEASLELPFSDESEDELGQVSVFTNRAPLVLAFAVTLLKYTMPQQPLSSRLSLAHAYVSVSSRSRAVDLGVIESSNAVSAQQDGWGQGQPVVKIMGKEIHVIRRPGYDPEDNGDNGDNGGNASDAASKPQNNSNTKADSSSSAVSATDGNGAKGKEAVEEFGLSPALREDALWGLDLEKLRSQELSNINDTSVGGNRMPIFTPQSARAYLLKAAGAAPASNSDTQESHIKRRSTKSLFAQINMENEQNLGRLLKAIDLLYSSWVAELGSDLLDKRTWGWYASVRPEIAQGREGWGAKNVVKLSDILNMRKK